MKKILILLLVVFSVTTYAQKEKNYKGMDQDFSPEQQAILKTKKMAFELDLSEAQQSQMLELNKKWATEREKNKAALKAQNSEEMSSTDKFNKMNAMLDMQLAHQKELKKVLNEDQYKIWQRTVKNKGFRSSQGREHQHGKDRNDKR